MAFSVMPLNLLLSEERSVRRADDHHHHSETMVAEQTWRQTAMQPDVDAVWHGLPWVTMEINIIKLNISA